MQIWGDLSSLEHLPQPTSWLGGISMKFIRITQSRDHGWQLIAEWADLGCHPE